MIGARWTPSPLSWPPLTPPRLTMSFLHLEEPQPAADAASSPDRAAHDASPLRWAASRVPFYGRRMNGR